MDGYLEIISLLGIPGNLVTWNGAELKSCPANGLNGTLVKLPNCPGDNTRSILSVTDVPRGSTKRVQFTEEEAIQDLRERAGKILAIRESEELAEEAVRLGRMVSSNAPLY